jgi:cleavage stimulation factor subunit 3
VGAFPIWKSYIDFVRNWPEMGMLDSGKKLRTLRELYQRAVCVAMDQAEEIWTDYEAFEKHNGEQTAEMILPDFNRKYLHAKSIMRERKKYMLNIVFDRLATPPANAPGELQQLEYWGQWIR